MPVKPSNTPPMGMFLAYIAVLPMVVGAVALWIAPESQAFLILPLTLFWGASILMFLAGVRRGVSFRTPGGPRMTQITMMLFLFAVGFVAIVATLWAYLTTAAVLEIAGFVSLAVLDPIAARSGDAPLFFARLRPLQMTIPVVMLVAVVVYMARSPLF